MNLRKAIPSHNTATSASAWDGGQNEKNLKEGQDYSYYKQMYAWVDPDKDDTTKSAYKFPHHEVSADGSIDAANVRGCQSIIGVLNGSMGGTDIPKDDYQGVWNHAARHLKDANMEPAQLNSIPDDIEVRTFMVSELRIDQGENKKPIIKGYASVFNQLSEDLGGFREQVAPGAFTNTIANDDIRALFNHDPNYVLGRTKNGTLRLTEDEKGLAIEIDPPNTQWSRDLQESIGRGDISQMSFGFRAIREKWKQEEKKMPIRTLIENWLRDVSPVTFPAYPQTSVKVRDYLNALSKSEKELDGQSAPKEGYAGRLERKRKLDIAERI